MKALVYEEYGTPDVLQIKQVAKPAPGEGEVLIKVHAASVNSWDWDMLRGKPFLVRMWGLFRPKWHILGSDIAGRVEAVGRGVTRFRPGDEVFGDNSAHGWGGFAEYVSVAQKLLARKPARMTFEQAAAIPEAGLLALQGLHKKPIQPGDRVLINGAGGGVGSFAVQLAKSRGAEVTGVDHTAKQEMMRSMGFDHVMDYTREDFTGTGDRYDLILDPVADRSLCGYLRTLGPEGRYVMVGGRTWTMFQVAVLGPLLSMFTKKKIGVLAWHHSPGDLDRMSELFEAGSVRPVIDRVYPLDEASEALRRIGEGRTQGKTVITMGGCRAHDTAPS